MDIVGLSMKMHESAWQHNSFSKVETKPPSTRKTTLKLQDNNGKEIDRDDRRLSRLSVISEFDQFVDAPQSPLLEKGRDWNDSLLLPDS